MNNATFAQRDLSVLWHPCTQMKDHESLPLISIKKGDGVFLEDMEGNRYIDAISSWWVNIFGHCNPTINNAIKQQLDTLEHVMLGGFTHEAAVVLSEKLLAVAPKGLSKCFYSDNGSSAVEIALKMSFQSWRNQGNHQKTKFVSLENSYHGETLGALSVSNVALYKETFAPLLLDIISAPSPDCYHREQGESWRNYSIRQFEPMETLLAQRHHEISAVIIEPLVQCAGNMRMYHPIYLTLLRAACDQYNVHLIADEVAVGFGRTGTLFGCEQADISPDFLCVAKGLTGGYLPLAATLTTEKIYQSFYDDYEKLTGFFHSHSYTGNALGCRAGIATLDIFQQQNILQKNKRLAQVMQQAVANFTEHPHIIDVRQTGMIVAIEFVKNKHTKEPFAWQQRRGLKVYEYALSKGVLLRPIGNVVYFIPPYIITEAQINTIAKVALEGIDRAVQN
ncbi:MAG: adenosylmethionine--8-amino-7-oxononanoate transaminase [Methylococcales bacterium]|nr:adenosylmethionine--8-amino-7-oxononanoate transaminase [Methylococcales bacterium]